MKERMKILDFKMMRKMEKEEKEERN